MTNQEVAKLVAPGEIAEMAGRTPAAVSNWRANPNLQFPDPVGGSAARPLFSELEVTTWLKSRGYEITVDRGERQIWSAFNGLRGKISIEALTAALLALMSARFIAESDRKVEAQWVKLANTSFEGTILTDYAHLADLANTSERLAGLADLPPELKETQSIAFEVLFNAVNSLKLDDFQYISNLVLRRLAGAQARSAGQYGLAGSKVSTLLANLVNGEAGIVYDPACGIGETLMQVQANAAMHTRLIGQDISEHALLVARQRNLFSRGSAHFVKSDVLAQDPDPKLRADFVVTEPPFGMKWDNPHAVADPRWNFGLPPRSSSEFLWIQHAIHHLAPNGCGYVVTSGAPTFSFATKNVRSNVVRSGCVEAVFALPGKMLPHTSIPLFLWVLRPPAKSETGTAVLLVDGSGEGNPEELARQWLTLGLGDDPDVHPPYARVSTDELLATEDVVLQPRRWIDLLEVDDADVSNEYFRALDCLTSARDDLAGLPLDSLTPGSFSQPRMVSIKDLTQQGGASLLRGKPLRDDNNQRVSGAGVTARQVRDGLPPTAADSGDAAKVAVGTKAARTERLDILFTTMNEVRAVIDLDGDRVLDNGVFALRVDRAILEPVYVAHCLTAAWNKRHQAGTTIQRADPKALEIAVIPIAEQRQVAELLESLERARIAATRVSHAAEVIETGLYEAVRHRIDLSVAVVDSPTYVGPIEHNGQDDSEGAK
jgi:hypothetical protein